MENKDRQFISERLAAGEKHDNIANALLMRRALEEVEEIAQEIEGRQRSMEQARQLYYFWFAGPMPKPKLISKEKGGNELWEKPARTEYKVREVDLPAFAKEFKLDLKALREVGEGQRREHKGWIASPHTMSLYELTKPYYGYADFQPAQTPPAPEPAHISWQHVSAPVVEWTPSK